MNVRYLLPLLCVSVLALGACHEKTAVEKAEDKVNDALDRRPAEAVRDAAEDLGDAAKDLGKEVGDAAADVGHDVQKAASETADDIKDAAHDAKKSAEEAVGH